MYTSVESSNSNGKTPSLLVGIGKPIKLAINPGSWFYTISNLFFVVNPHFLEKSSWVSGFSGSASSSAGLTPLPQIIKGVQVFCGWPSPWAPMSAIPWSAKRIKTVSPSWP